MAGAPKAVSHVFHQVTAWDFFSRQQIQQQANPGSPPHPIKTAPISHPQVSKAFERGESKLEWSYLLDGKLFCCSTNVSFILSIEKCLCL
jgi:hypothetical protein